MIKTDPDIIPKGKYEDLGELDPAIKSLVERGFAKLVSQNESSIIISYEGLLMGQVIKDYEGRNLWHKHKYLLFYILTWATVSASSFLIIYNAVVIIKKLIFG